MLGQQHTNFSEKLHFSKGFINCSGHMNVPAFEIFEGGGWVFKVGFQRKFVGGGKEHSQLACTLLCFGLLPPS